MSKRGEVQLEFVYGLTTHGSIRQNEPARRRSAINMIDSGTVLDVSFRFVLVI